MLAPFTSLGLTPVIASEIEFYLFGSDGRDVSVFWNAIRAECVASGIEIFNIEKERGYEQYEISLRPSGDIEKIIHDTDRLKEFLIAEAEKCAMQVDFSAKPLADDFGSGLHIHVHLENAQGENQFFKDDETISDILNHALGGLLLWLPDTMPLFAPNASSYSRFVAGNNVPLNASWGANNRTVALRLPDAAHDNKHIEHRVAGSDADTGQVIHTILASIHYGLTNKVQPNEQIYGDASLAMYDLSAFPPDLEEALQRMRYSSLPLGEYDVLIKS